MSKANGLTPAQEERLYIIAEEADEVGKAALKILRHGYDSWNNRQDLEKELGHLDFAMKLLAAKEEISCLAIKSHSDLKGETIAPWLHYQGKIVRSGTTYLVGEDIPEEPV